MIANPSTGAINVRYPFVFGILRSMYNINGICISNIVSGIRVIKTKKPVIIPTMYAVCISISVLNVRCTEKLKKIKLAVLSIAADTCMAIKGTSLIKGTVNKGMSVDNIKRNIAYLKTCNPLCLVKS